MTHTVELQTVIQLVSSLKKEKLITDEEYTDTIELLAQPEMLEDGELLSALHLRLLKKREVIVQVKDYFDSNIFSEAVEEEVAKINSLVGIYHKDNGATSYVIRDLTISGDRDYIEKSTKEGIKDWLKRNGIRITMVLLDRNTKKTMTTVDTFEAWVTSAIAEEHAIVGFTKVPTRPDEKLSPIINKKLNVFRSGFPKPEKGTEHLEVLKFLKEVTCGGSEYSYDILIKWLAHLVQRPAEKNNLALSIYHPDRGVGKGTTASIIKRIVGARNAVLDAAPKDLEGFNMMISGKMFINFDETMFAGDHNHHNIMKRLVTEGTERREGKGKDATSIPSFCRILLTTNNASGTLASAFERRYFDLHISRKWKDAGIIDDFVDRHYLRESQGTQFITQDGVYDIPWVRNLVYHLLYEVELKGFNFNNVESEVRGDLALNSRIMNTYRENPLFAFFWEWLASGEDEIEYKEYSELEKREVYKHIRFGQDKIQTFDFIKMYEQHTKQYYKTQLSHNDFVRRLQAEFGFKKRLSRIAGISVAKYVFTIPTREELYQMMFVCNNATRVKWTLPPLKDEEDGKIITFPNLAKAE